MKQSSLDLSIDVSFTTGCVLTFEHPHTSKLWVLAGGSMENLHDFAALLQETDRSESLKLISSVDRKIDSALRYSRLDKYDIILLQSYQLEQILDWAANKQDIDIYLGMGMLCIGWRDPAWFPNFMIWIPHVFPLRSAK